MLKREDVYHIIDNERTYQDVKYDPSDVLSSGQYRKERELDPAAGIVLLEAYARKASDSYVNSRSNNLEALQRIAQIAAIAVRILERAGGSEVLINEGLR